jgi:peptidoglycan LD-endopeptidase CwlK
MGKFNFSERSLNNLKGVHPDLVKLMTQSLEVSPIDFAILEGLRSPERQQEVIAQGASWTKNSRHLTGHAVDIGAVIEGHIVWSLDPYQRLSKIIKKVAEDLSIQIEWGGDWPKVDAGHYELKWHDYPLK